jgi:hypothetical protein
MTADFVDVDSSSPPIIPVETKQIVSEKPSPIVQFLENPFRLESLLLSSLSISEKYSIISHIQS